MDDTRTLQSEIACRRRGFSLIELIVVVGVIALLIGILLPALGGAVRAAREGSARAGVRNMGLGLQVFENQLGFSVPLMHDGTFDGSGDLRGNKGTVVDDLPTYVRGARDGRFTATRDQPVQRVVGASSTSQQLVLSTYQTGLNDRFLRGVDQADGEASILARYNWSMGSGVRASAWTRANQRYSTLSLPYFLSGIGPAFIDGVDGEGMTRPTRTGAFEGVTVGSFALPLDVVRQPQVDVSVATPTRLEPFFIASGSVTSQPLYFDAVEMLENGFVPSATANQNAEDSVREEFAQDRQDLAFGYSTVFSDVSERAIRYYRWQPEATITRPSDLNIPAVLISPEILERFTLSVDDFDRFAIDLTDGSNQLRNARWAIVSAGPNGVFGTERLDELITALGRPVDPMNAQQVLDLRIEAWEDNAVELGN
ncbi:MAG: type II secretion system protein [Planctomycetota bacterium]